MTVICFEIRETCWSSVNRLHRNEQGTIAFSIPIGLFFFMVFAGLVFNTGVTINGKIETQNVADASTYSASVNVARGLNAITASNHLIGELNALYVIHHSLGGTWLDEKGSQENKNGTVKTTNTALDVAFKTANNISRDPPNIPLQQALYDRVKKFPAADINSTIYEAKERLKQVMIAAYVAHGAGAALIKVGQGTSPFGSFLIIAGVVVQGVSLLTQLAVVKEYLVLDGLEILARFLSPFKKAIPGLISGIHNFYQQGLVTVAPTLAAEASIKIAEHNGMVPIPSNSLLSTATSLTPPFPVEKETTTNEERSQMMRATYPWVAYWSNNISTRLRKPFRLISAPISGAGGFYEDWTDIYALQAAEFMRTKETYRRELTRVNHGKQGNSGSGVKGKGVKMYVLKGLNETGNKAGWHKSRESWNNWDNVRASSSEIDKLFCHIGFVRSKSPPKLGVQRFFRQENPHGFVCYAQSMVYNANPQQKPKNSGGNGAPQPSVGWDTLNWTANAIEYKGSLSSRPRIKLNWQAKLMPISPEKLLSKAQVLAVDENLRKTFWGSRESLLILNNH